jgi:prevent-host-death family protein
MSHIYSTYEAKARFSELLRKVREGQTVRISYHGKEVAELRPIRETISLEEHLAMLRERGTLTQGRETPEFRPLARKPGALQRFLESRE